MPTLPTDLRNKLEGACITARNLAERAATDALKSLAVAHHEPYGHMKPEQRTLRNKLRARARQLGDTQDPKGQLGICAHSSGVCLRALAPDAVRAVSGGEQPPHVD